MDGWAELLLYPEATDEVAAVSDLPFAPTAGAKHQNQAGFR